jgi:hypothetical protein
MGDTLADDQALLFVYRNPDSVIADPNFIFIRVTGHASRYPSEKGLVVSSSPNTIPSV